MNIMKNKKRIALFGGSFDPPHSGHVVAITVIVKSNLVDEIWLVPAGIRDDKASKVSNDDRKAMISVMLLETFDTKVPVHMNTTQIDKSWELSTTSGLITEMEMLYPDYKFSFVIGSDLIQEIPKWKSPEKLMKKGFFLVVPRLGDKIPDVLPDYVTLVPAKNIALTNASSTMVRKLLSEGESLEGIVPPSVINYIVKNNLYKYKTTKANQV